MKHYSKHFLMIKIHNKTGLKYLCKKSANDRSKCFTYKGSGTYWKRHLEKHGCDITTEIIEECNTKQELTERGIYWSELLDVVNSGEWANLVPERGDGGPTMLGRQITAEQKIRQGKAISNSYHNSSDAYKEQRRLVNSKSHEIYRYYTPIGIFTNAFKAAEANNCSNVTILNRCMKDVDKPILSKKYWRFGWRGMTWRQLGWYSEPLNSESFVPQK